MTEICQGHWLKKPAFFQSLVSKKQYFRHIPQFLATESWQKEPTQRNHIFGLCPLYRSLPFGLQIVQIFYRVSIWPNADWCFPKRTSLWETPKDWIENRPQIPHSYSLPFQYHKVSLLSIHQKETSSKTWQLISLESRNFFKKAKLVMKMYCLA